MSFNPKIIGADKTKNSGGAANLLIVDQEAKVFSISGFNSGPDQFLQWFEGSSEPADGTAPVGQLPIYSGANFGKEWTMGRPFPAGCVVVVSTTSMVKTKGDANCLLDITFN